MESSVASNIARGVLLENHGDRIVLGISGTDYRLHLNVPAPIAAARGSSITGRIEAHARRIDITRTGGHFIDPVYGRPRIIQGRVIETALEHPMMVVKAVVPLHIRVRPPQNPSDFEIGAIVNFSVDSGAQFIPVDEPH